MYRAVDRHRKSKGLITLCVVSLAFFLIFLVFCSCLLEFFIPTCWLSKTQVKTSEKREKNARNLFYIRGDIKIPPLKLVTFCRKMSNVCWWSFVDQLHPHHMLGSKVTWATTGICCFTILGNVFLSNGGSSHQPSANA